MEKNNFIKNNSGIEKSNADVLPFLEISSVMDTSTNILRIYQDGSLYYLFGSVDDGNWLKINELTELGMSLLHQNLVIIRDNKYKYVKDAEREGYQMIKFCLDKNYFQCSAPITPDDNNLEINELQHIINRNLK